MKIGLDFDNTIVSYDRLFHTVAVEQGLVPQSVLATKLGVRDYLRAENQEDRWTALQGYVYGDRMAEADAFPGVEAFLQKARAMQAEVFIVSHKTRHPYIGPKYDLHGAARAWVEGRLEDAEGPLVDERNVFFELTKEEKVVRVATIGCDWFVDDLPEIFEAPGFPRSTRRILFDPTGVHDVVPGTLSVQSWKALQGHLEQCR